SRRLHRAPVLVAVNGLVDGVVDALPTGLELPPSLADAPLPEQVDLLDAPRLDAPAHDPVIVLPYLRLVAHRPLLAARAHAGAACGLVGEFALDGATYFLGAGALTLRRRSLPRRG